MTQFTHTHTRTFTCYLLFISIISGIFPPSSFAQKTTDKVEDIPSGLLFRIREAASEVPNIEPSNIPIIENLSPPETEAIFRRLPPMPPANLPDSDFKMRGESLPPRKNGKTIPIKFEPEVSISPAELAAKSLEVMRFSPSGSVPIVSDLSATFSQPMVDISSQSSENVPVNLSPEVKGNWRWIGTQTLIFDSETRFPMATTFTATIPAGTKSILGKTLEKDVSWTFSTPPPRVLKVYQANTKVKRDAVLIASFDQAINPAALFSKVSAYANGKKIGLQMASETEIAGDRETAKIWSEIQPNRGIAIRAKENLPAGAEITLSFEKDIPSAEGILKTETAQDFTFETYGQLKFEKSYCGWSDNNEPCRGYHSFSIDFNNQLDKSFDTSLIKVKPAIEDQKITVSGDSIEITGYRKSRTKYTVRIPKTLKDEFGQALGKDVSASFSIEPDAPWIYAEGDEFITLDPNARPRYSVYSTNYKSFKARIYAVEPNDFKQFFYYHSELNLPLPNVGTLVFEKEFKIKAKTDESTETEFDLSSAMKGGFGHAILIIEPPDKNQDVIVKWLQKTNIGINAISDYEKLSIFASDIRNGKPLENVEISLPGFASAYTSENGIGEIALPERGKSKGNWLVARNGSDSAILRENFRYGNENWFATEPRDSLRWFVFDDRNIYRPGETVSVKGYIRKIVDGKFTDVSELGDSVNSLFYVLRDPRGNEIAKGSPEINAFGAFDFQIELSENINLGYQKLEFITDSKLKNGKNSLRFQVQEFRRPEFEVSAKVQSDGPFFVGDSAKLSASASYYSGGALKNAKTNWSAAATPTNYTPPNRQDFMFGEYVPYWRYQGSGYQSKEWKKFEGKTDTNGTHSIELDFVTANPARPFRVETTANIADVNRQTFSGSTSLLVHPSQLYVGLRTPKTFIKKGEKLKVETIATDVDGNAVQNARISVIAELLDWEKVDGSWQQVIVDTQKCDTRSDVEPVSCEFDAKQGGSFSIKASVWDSRERRNESELKVWVAGGNSEESDSVEEEDIELIPDKAEYAPGETAEILVNSPVFPAEGVVTIERNGVLKTERFSMNENSTILKIPVVESYLPNFHVRVDVAGALPRVFFEDERDAKAPKRPAYAGGEINLNVSTESRKLSVSAETRAKTLEPGGETLIDVDVKDFEGKSLPNAEVAIVAVDESVLSLTNYKISDPLETFYAKIDTNTASFNSRENIILVDPEDNESGQGIGRGYGSGDGNASGSGGASYGGGRQPDSVFRKLEILTSLQNPPAVTFEKSDQIKMRQNFDALAIFSPSVITDESGKATVKLKLPDNLTRYRITAVAVTKSKLFGVNESNITAKQSLQVRPSAPRFLNFGDTAEIPVVVQNQTDLPMTVNLAIRAQNASLTEGNGRQVTIPANDRAEIQFPVGTQKVGTARFQVGAVSAGFADAAQFEFPVYTPATSESFATYGTTDGNDTIIQQIAAPEDVFSQFGGLEVTTSSTQLQELTDAFLYLQSYPFECSEQISSRVISVAALRDVLNAFDSKDLPSSSLIRLKMLSDIARLSELQHSDGGFSFWRSDDASIPFLSVHVAHAVARAKQKGYEIPRGFIEKSLSYLKNIEGKLPKEYSAESRWAISAYALFVRDQLGDKDSGKALELLNESGIEKLSPESLGWVLSVLAGKNGSEDEIEAIKTNLLNRVTETADTASFTTNYEDGEFVLLSSDKRTDAVVLESLLSLNQSKDAAIDSLIPKIVRGLLASKVKGRWRSTQENAFVLLALDKYFQLYEKAAPNFATKIWLGNSFAGEQKFIGRSTDSNLINVPMSYLKDQETAQNLTLDKRGDGRLYYRIGMKYAPTNLKLAAADRGFAVSRIYEAVDDPEDVIRNKDGSWTIRSGARIRVRLQMIATARRNHVALVDNLPAGIETINPELAVSNTNDVSDSPAMQKMSRWFQHQNLRDNRTEAFTTYLPAGVWNYSFLARATTPGNFVAAPAKAEEMYSPETFGKSKTDFVRVK